MKPARGNRQAGSMVVEAAFTLLTLFTFLLAIMEAGRFFQMQQFVTDAAHEGARMGVRSLTGNDFTSYAGTSTIYESVRQFLAPAGIVVSPGDVTVDCVDLSKYPPQDESTGTPCTFGCTPVDVPCGTRVTVSTQYQIMTLAMFANLKIPLKGKAVMANETPY